MAVLYLGFGPGMRLLPGTGIRWVFFRFVGGLGIGGLLGSGPYVHCGNRAREMAWPAWWASFNSTL